MKAKVKKLFENLKIKQKIEPICWLDILLSEDMSSMLTSWNYFLLFTGTSEKFS